MARVRMLSILRMKSGEVEVDVPAKTVDELLAALQTRFGPEFGQLVGHCKVIVNGRNVVQLKRGRTPLTDEDEVFLLPPVGGG